MGISLQNGVNALKKCQLLEEIVLKTNKIINDYLFLCRYRLNPAYFSREGKLGFVNIMSFILNIVKKTLQIELDDFFKAIKEEQNRVSKQAFSEARNKIAWEAFEELYRQTVKTAYEANDLSYFEGYRLSAIDGTSLAVDNSKELIEYFGSSGRGCQAATARASCLYDLQNNIIIDALISPFSVGERRLAQMHLDKLIALGTKNDLVLFDRGYYAKKLVVKMFENGIHFLMRIRRKAVKDSELEGINEGTFNIRHSKGAYTVRFVKFALPSGEIETLITNLPSDKFSISVLKNLYAMRWGVETVYGVIKSKLQLENFSGRTVLAVKQDFYASMYLANVACFAKYISDENIREDNKEKDLKYAYQTNTNILIGKLKDDLILAILVKSNRKRLKMLRRIITEISRSRVPIIEDRHNPRNIPRKKRFHSNQKSSL